MKAQRLIGFLWLGLLLGAAVFCIVWGRTPTGEAQPMFGRAAESTMRVVTVRITAPAETKMPAAYSAPPSVTPMPTPTPVPTPDTEPFSLFWYSDTQYYAYRRPEIFRAMTQWSVDHAAEYNALAVLHTGDIVDNHNYERHWRNASSALALLRDRLPLYCIAGNHDVGADSVDYTNYLQNDFCDVRAAQQRYQNGVCWVQPLDRQKLLLLGIGWQKGTPYLGWAQKKCTEYPDYTVVLLVHSFLEDNGTLTDNGKLLEQSLIADTPNLRLVLCGHKDGSVRWQKTYDDNTRTVNALMYNFQDDKTNGLGYLRILTFDPDLRSLSVTTYSPFLDDYNYYSNESLDSFTLFNAF